jgi:undecaprenyl-diphosphatase
MNPLDQRLFLWLNLSDQVPAWLMQLALLGSTVWPKVMLVAVMLALMVGPAPWRRAALHAVLAMLVAWLIVRGISTAWPQPRPFVLGVGQQWLAKEPSPSFPSSHAAIAWAVGAAACWWARHPLAHVARAALLLSALLIAWSRVALGLHFPSDTLAGMLVGVLAAWATVAFTRLLAKRLGRGFRDVRPLAVPPAG